MSGTRLRTGRTDFHKQETCWFENVFFSKRIIHLPLMLNICFLVIIVLIVFLVSRAYIQCVIYKFLYTLKSIYFLSFTWSI